MKAKRFSVKELREWLFDTAEAMLEDNSMDDGTCYYKNVGSWLCVVMCWSEYDDMEFIPDLRYMKSSGKRKDLPSCEEYEHARQLEVSLRVREPISEWGNLPSDFKYAIGDDKNGYEGGLGLDNSDYADKMKSMARYISSERTELIKRYGN